MKRPDDLEITTQFAEHPTPEDLRLLTIIAKRAGETSLSLTDAAELRTQLLPVNTTLSSLLKDVGYSGDVAKGQDALCQSLCRLAGVNVTLRRGGKMATTTLLSFHVDEALDHVDLRVSPIVERVVKTL